MRLTKILVTMGMILLLAGCEPQESLNPLFTDKDVVFDPALVGTWITKEWESTKEDKDMLNLMFQKSGDAAAYTLIETGKDDGNQVQIKYKAHLLQLREFLFLDLTQEEPAVSELAQNSYKLKLIQSRSESRFEPHLLKLGELVYLELVPQESGEDGDFDLRVIQAHWFFRIWIDGDVLRLSEFDDGWFEKIIDEGRIDIDHERVSGKGETVLTASTEALQTFVLDHVEDEGAFEDLGEWHRQK